MIRRALVLLGWAWAAGCADPSAGPPPPPPRGVEAPPRAPVGLELREGRAVLKAPWPGSSPVAVGLRAVRGVEASAVREIWELVPAGVEHRFEVSRLPEPPTLVLDLAVEGARVAVDPGARGAVFRPPLGPELGYRGLRAFDARGRSLPATIRPVAGGLELVVDARGAAAPLSVDPIVGPVDWVAPSPFAGANVGSAVDGAGDVDGDGYDDLVVGAPDQRAGGSAQGGLALFPGSPTGPAAVATWSALGGLAGARLGHAVAGAGDVDGDGFGEILAGAPGWGGAHPEEGAAVLWLGGPGGPGPNPDWSAVGGSPSANLGSSVAAAGDLNGDGYADLAVGAPGWSQGLERAGRVSVFFGGPTGPSAVPDWTWSGRSAGDAVGEAVAGVGDVDGDGYDDLAVGAPGQGEVGAALLFLGSAAGLGSEPDWVGGPGPGSGWYGASLDGAGDVDGDGHADLIVGSPDRDQGQTWAGTAYLYRGSPSGLEQVPSWVVAMESAWTFGSSVAGVGDVDGDGYDDVGVGGPRESAFAFQSGAVRLFLGSAGGLRTEPAWVAGAEVGDAAIGKAVAAAGDLNGDGLADLAAGAPTYQDDTRLGGTAIVYFGSDLADTDADGLADVQDRCPSTADPAQADLDGDGIGDACDAPHLEVRGAVTWGGRVELVASGLVPGELARFGGAIGGPSPATCAPPAGPTCLQLGPTPVDLGSAVADAEGTATVAVAVPAILAPGVACTLQAGIRRGGGGGAWVASPPVVLDPSSLDLDGDGLSDAAELEAGTDPSLSDTDSDGATDAAELAGGLDPLRPDTDGDGVEDGVDRCGAGADGADLDGDGVPDGCDNCVSAGNPDQADGDGDGGGDACDLGHAPTAADLRLAPASPVEGDRVTCRYRFLDQDGDPDRSRVVWARNGAQVGEGPVLPVAAVAGDRISCAIRPSDGSMAGPVALVSATVAPRPGPGNLLLIVADDLGADQLGIYGIGSVTPHTPRIDGLASRGVLFRRAYGHPVCSPSRAALQTGRSPVDTGVTVALPASSPVSLSLSEILLPEMLDAGTQGAYASSMVGKWHLGGAPGDMWNQPTDQGYGWYSGSITGFASASAVDGLPQDYLDWEKTTNGAVSRTTTYATTDTADDAIARIAAMPEPWLLVVSFNAPHSPLHWPPAGLYTDPPGSHEDSQRYHAMVEAMDTELGRILDALTPAQEGSTTILFTGDNGAWSSVIEPPLRTDRGKATLYEGGVHVPMIVAGPWVDVPGSASDALVHHLDVYATFAEIAGIAAPVGGEDSISFLPSLRDPEAPSARAHATAEILSPAGGGPIEAGRQMITDGRWKLIEYHLGPRELYDLAGRTHEGPDLLSGPLDPESQAAYDSLVAALPYELP